jgi:adenylate cyclase class 2
MKLEIEVKAKIKDFEIVKNKLKKLGCVLSLPIIQDDYIYNKKGINLYKDHGKSPILRIRKQDKKILFTLKKNRNNELDCIEKELEVSNENTLRDIFELLDYESNVEVHKKRIKTNYKDYEICLDEVDELGSYIEVEKMSEENGEKVQNELFDFLQTLGVLKEDRVFNGYDTLIYLKNNPK